MILLTVKILLLAEGNPVPPVPVPIVVVIVRSELFVKVGGGRPVSPGTIVILQCVQAEVPIEIVVKDRVMALIVAVGVIVVTPVTVVLDPSWLAGIAEPIPLLVQRVGMGIVEVWGIIVGSVEYMLPFIPSKFSQSPYIRSTFVPAADVKLPVTTDP